MRRYKKLSHALCYCTYRVIWVPKSGSRVLNRAVNELVERDIRGMNKRLVCEVSELDVRGGSCTCGGADSFEDPGV